MNTIQLVVDHIKQETPDTATFYLKETTGRKINYQPGQFITLVFTHHGEEIRRSYSLSSSPDETLLSITVKRIQNGEISRYLLAYVKTGEQITAIEPAGRFLLPSVSEPRRLIYFAAGSGIVPVFSHLKYALTNRPDLNFVLVYSSLTTSDTIFKADLDRLSQAYPNRLTINYHISEKGDRLNNQMLEKLVNKFTNKNYSNTLFYTCGPFTYMRMVQLTLLYMGIDQEQIKRENFVLETVPVTSTISVFPPRKIRILFNGEWHMIMAGENQSILQAALQNNISLPFSCRGGVCSACTARCQDGKVEMVRNEVLTPEDIGKGYVLTCTGYALTDDVIIRFD